MRRVVGVLVLVTVVAVGWWLWQKRSHAPEPNNAPGAPAAERTPDSRPSPAAGPRSDAPAGDEPSQARGRRPSAEQLARRNAMRQRILDSIHARERAAEERGGASSGGSTGEAEPLPSAREEGEDEDDAPATGGLVDRTGNHEYLVEVMNQDLMPLADECYAMALEEQPGLRGMLVMNLELIGEEEIGGVVESIQPGPDNELAQPGLVECVRESILSTTLPPPPSGGRDAISLSLRLSPDEE